MEEKLEALYSPLIRDRQQSPRYYEKRPEAAQILDAYNPVCGDKYKIYLDLEAGRIRQATFYGHGCAVSKASLSVLLEKIQGCTLEEVRTLLATFDAALRHPDAPPPADAELAAFMPARQFPGRMDCVWLGWGAVGGWVQDDLS